MCHHLEKREKKTNGQIVERNQGGGQLDKKSNGIVTNEELHNDQDNNNDVGGKWIEHYEENKQETNTTFEKTPKGGEETENPDEILIGGSSSISREIIEK